MDYWPSPGDSLRTPEQIRAARRIHIAAIFVGIGLGLAVFLVLRRPEWSLLAAIRSWFGLLP